MEDLKRSHKKRRMLYKVYMRRLITSFILTIIGVFVFIFSGSKCFDMIKSISAETTLPQFNSGSWILTAMICVTILFQLIVLDFTVIFAINIIHTVKKINSMAENSYDPLLNRIRKDMGK